MDDVQVREGSIDAPASPPDRRRTERRQAMLEAARDLFVEHGFAGVALSAVVRRSGGSLATLYALFGSKEGLLRAVMAEGRDHDLAAFEQFAESGAAPQAVLRFAAETILRKLASPDRLALTRIAVAESLRNPDFARAFHEQVREPAIAYVAALLARWTREGRAAVDHPVDAAEQFLSLVMHGEMDVLFCGGGCIVEDGRSVDWRIAPFLSHYRIA